MATSKEYAEFILGQFAALSGVRCRKMMGEYVLYYREKVAALICDNRLLVKTVPSAERLMPSATREPPYEGAKPMLLVENVDDAAFLCELFVQMYDELPFPKKKK